MRDSPGASVILNDRRRVVVEPRVESAERAIAPLFRDLGRRLEAMYETYTTDQLRLILDYTVRLNGILRQAIAGLED